MADLIDRQAAIHEIHKQVWLAETAKTFLTEALNELPSAQPEPHEVCTDLIDRQEAIEAIVKESHKDGAYGYVDASDATKVLNALPSADIDLSGFSDKLWQTAYERGKAEAVRHDVTDTNVGDMISRQAAIDATWFEPSYTDPLNVLTEVRDRLKVLPSAQPEPIKVSVDHAMTEEELKELKQKIADSPVILLPSAQPEREKGIWINKGRIVRCNKCKIGYATVKGMKSALTYNFCPNCGADMRGEQDG